MKKSFSFLIMLTIGILTSSVFGQKKNSLTVSVIADNYTGIKDEHYDGRKMGYNRLPSPGTEIIYMREIFNGLNIGTGISYQLGFMGSFIDYNETRFRFNDICFPLLLKKYVKIKDFKHLYTTAGIYFGKTTNIKAQYPTSYEWKSIPDNSTIANYSDDDRYSDFYFDFGFHTSLSKRSVFSVAPFFKYRINTTWLNYHQKKLHYGVKLSYSISF
jgi:hypothetical protein